MDLKNLEILYTIYFKTQNDNKRGADLNLVRRILMITDQEMNRRVRELFNSRYLTGNGTYGDDVALTISGEDFLLKNLSRNRPFILQFTNPQPISPSSKLMFAIQYNYHISENGIIVKEGTIAIYVSDVLAMQWQLNFEGKSPNDASKLLLQFAKQGISDAFMSGSLTSDERIEYTTQDTPVSDLIRELDLLNIVDAKFIIFAGTQTNSSGLNTSLNQLTKDTSEQIQNEIQYNRDLNWYYNANNIRNQQLVFDTIAFIEQYRSSITTPIDFLNLLYKQIDKMRASLEKPVDFINELIGLPISEKVRFTLMGMVLKWHGGYPVKNLNEQYNTILKLVEKQFLNTQGNNQEPELEFCRIDGELQKKPRSLEADINGKLETSTKENAIEDNPASIPEVPPSYVEEVIETPIVYTPIPSEAHAFKSPIQYRQFSNGSPILGISELARDLGDILASMQAEKGQMIGIFGRWGRGKTFFLKQLTTELSKIKHPKFIQVDYHAWKYQETPASWAYLYEQFVNGFVGNKDEDKCTLQYQWNLIRLNFARNGVAPILKFVGSIVVALASIFAISQYSTAVTTGVIAAWVVVIVTYFSKLKQEYSTKAVELIKKYQLRSSFRTSLGIQADIQDELIKLLKVWIPESECGKKRIVLVVEDIDRCNEERIIQNIDALRVLLEDEDVAKRVLIITAIDERILKNAILIKYRAILDIKKAPSADTNLNEQHELISEYLDKLFIAAIKLGGLSNFHVKEFMLQLLSNEQTSVTAEIISQNSTSENTTLRVDQRVERDNNGPSEEAGRSEPHTHIITLNRNLPPTEQLNSSAPSYREPQHYTNEELDCLNKLFGHWDSPTPRKMRIFYYRYLLCKDQLINKYASLSRPNIWQNRLGIDVVMEMIHFYSVNGNLQTMSEDKRNIYNAKEEILRVPRSKEPSTVARVDLVYLYEILELIIAY